VLRGPLNGTKYNSYLLDFFKYGRSVYNAGQRGSVRQRVVPANRLLAHTRDRGHEPGGVPAFRRRGEGDIRDVRI